MSQFFEYVKIALFNIKANKMRSLLTMLGIIIGISSVVLIASAGNGVKNGIYKMLNDMMGGQISVYTDSSKTEGTVVHFSADDLEYLKKELDHIKGISPGLGLANNVYTEDKKGELQSTMLRMVTEDGIYSSADPIVKGRYFSKDEVDAATKVCVISESDADRLFGSKDVIGSLVEVSVGGRYVSFRIIGIRESKESGLASLFKSSRVTLEIPYTIMQNTFGGNGFFSQINLYGEDAKYEKEIVDNAIRLMEARHNVRGENVIAVDSFASDMATFNTVLTSLTAFISAVAMISLLVGGIGIMNIMLVSVAERTREIGVRKALGAKTAYILFQFLMEGGILSLLGGIIGIALGLLTAESLCLVASKFGAISIVADFNPLVIFGAALFSTAIGVFFTFYPARKAAKLNPIEALRHE